eukprot:gene5741-11610_t
MSLPDSLNNLPVVSDLNSNEISIENLLKSHDNCKLPSDIIGESKELALNALPSASLADSINGELAVDDSLQQLAPQNISPNKINHEIFTSVTDTSDEISLIDLTEPTIVSDIQSPQGNIVDSEIIIERRVKDGDNNSTASYINISQDQTFTVSITQSGPLLIRLKMHPVFRFAIVHGFDRRPDGSPGEAEMDGRVGSGDAFLSINGISLQNKKSFKEIVAVIKSESSEGKPRELVFVRKHSVQGMSLKIGYLRRNSSGSGGGNRSSHIERYNNMLQVLSEPCISLTELRWLATQGIPDINSDTGTGATQGTSTSSQGLRPLIWRITLGYLPEEKANWLSFLESRRNMYKDFEKELIRDITRDKNGRILSSMEDEEEMERENSSKAHIPNRDRDSDREDDLTLSEEIEKDVVRTYPEMSFFVENNGLHHRALQRILLLYAKLNTGGMNEIVGTLYYVLASDPDEQWRLHAEADTFFCFTQLMDLFIRRMDESDSGICGRILEFTNVLHAHDPVLVSVMRNQGLDPTFFSLRWMTTLMSREFDLPDTIRLWDALFADTDRTEFMCYLCCAMVIEQRDNLLTGDFSENLRLLQTYPPTPISLLLETASLLRDTDKQRKKTMEPLQKLQHELQVGREFLGAAVAAAKDRTEQVTEVAKTIWMPAVASAVTRFVNTTTTNVRKIVNEFAEDGIMLDLERREDIVATVNDL